MMPEGAEPGAFAAAMAAEKRRKVMLMEVERPLRAKRRSTAPYWAASKEVMRAQATAAQRIGVVMTATALCLTLTSSALLPPLRS